MIDEEYTETVAEAEEGVEEITDEPITDDEGVSPKDDEPEVPEVDYSRIVEEDLETLRTSFPELRGIESITELEKPMRYAALRDLGLTAKEAYLATTERRVRMDNRSHLSSAVPKGAGSPVSTMTRSELERARELFPGLGDSEIQKLYKKVRA